MADFKFINNGENKIYNLSEEEILKAEDRMGIRFPGDLRQLYLEVGYGFIKEPSNNAINRIMGPGTVANVKLREGVFEFDPDLEELDEEDKLIFFEVNEGIYISLDLKLPNNPVFYFDTQIADSLEDFLKKFINDNEYYIDLE
ncbi:SMI1/KNR4 family protein [Priestia megaterium]|nr:SMI1/KNR4 family protein [Priestia megaterium]MDD9795831.1 SMI1/KNR4 family protein [Priestia megaterium]PET71989.1 SMI1/KNR4 family protein [Priestia megaterium]PFK88107.1 SMI1/KNR4 family protein [Priestia megaterium]PGN11369.1 SMI1/KNR4 family protein [Priestia megaterium]PGQ88729.1 SMI1/KNR4 family protein [Priestia megaterium]